MVHYLMLHMPRQAGSEIRHASNHQGAPILSLLSSFSFFFFMCMTGLSDLLQTPVGEEDFNSWSAVQSKLQIEADPWALQETETGFV